MAEVVDSYCSAIRKGKFSDLHGEYHDTEYGFRIEDDNALFGRLILEINQAGLSWDTVIRKKEGIRKAYANFEINKVAKFDDNDEARLLSDPGIIRNKLKVKAAIYNANAFLGIKVSHGSVVNWLDAHHPLPIEDWVKLFKQNFKFTGGEITKEFLTSTGFIPGAHAEDCPIFGLAAKTKPKWMESSAV